MAPGTLRYVAATGCGTVTCPERPLGIPPAGIQRCSRHPFRRKTCALRRAAKPLTPCASIDWLLRPSAAALGLQPLDHLPYPRQPLSSPFCTLLLLSLPFTRAKRTILHYTTLHYITLVIVLALWCLISGQPRPPLFSFVTITGGLQPATEPPRYPAPKRRGTGPHRPLFMYIHSLEQPASALNAFTP